MREEQVSCSFMTICARTRLGACPAREGKLAGVTMNSGSERLVVAWGRLDAGIDEEDGSWMDIAMEPLLGVGSSGTVGGTGPRRNMPVSVPAPARATGR